MSTRLLHLAFAWGEGIAHDPINKKIMPSSLSPGIANSSLYGTC